MNTRALRRERIISGEMNPDLAKIGRYWKCASCSERKVVYTSLAAAAAAILRFLHLRHTKVSSMINATNNSEHTTSIAILSLGVRLFRAPLLGGKAAVLRLVDDSESEGDEVDVRFALTPIFYGCGDRNLYESCWHSKNGSTARGSYETDKGRRGIVLKSRIIDSRWNNDRILRRQDYLWTLHRSAVTFADGGQGNNLVRRKYQINI